MGKLNTDDKAEKKIIGLSSIERVMEVNSADENTVVVSPNKISPNQINTHAQSLIPEIDESTRLMPSKNWVDEFDDDSDIGLVSLKKNKSSDNKPFFNSFTSSPESAPPHDFEQTIKAEKSQEIQNKYLLTEALDSASYGVLKERFVLESVLGAGGMGIVYKAKDLLKVEAKDRNPYVAIKVLSDEFKAHPEAFISLQRESRKSQSIAHPNIVSVYDFDRDGDIVFMTMEYMDGQPLDQMIRKNRSSGIPNDEAWKIIQGMSAALSYAHSEQIIHSDFKPGNVFITKKGIAKVFDFGIARAVKRVEAKDVTSIDKTLFDAGNLGALTPAYASFEMLSGEEPDIRDDIFALGCVAYELLTGIHPYKKIPANEAVKKNIKPKRINHISNEQWDAIEKAIELKREQRMSTVNEFMVAITPKTKALNWLAIFFLFLSFSITGFFLWKENKFSGFELSLDINANKPAIVAEKIESEFKKMFDVELAKDIKAAKQRLIPLLKHPVFMSAWEDKVWENISDLLLLTHHNDPWVEEKVSLIYEQYLIEITKVIDLEKYNEAKLLIENAKRYTINYDELDFKLYEMMSSLESLDEQPSN